MNQKHILIHEKLSMADPNFGNLQVSNNNLFKINAYKNFTQCTINDEKMVNYYNLKQILNTVNNILL